MRFGRTPTTSQDYGGKPLPGVWKEAGRSTATAGSEPLSGPSADKSASRVARVEAILWLADEPMTLKKLARVASLHGVTEARELVEVLRRRLLYQRSAVEITEVAGGLRLMTRACFSPWLERFGENTAASERGPRLSHAAAETLAIVAYRQPVVRAEVEAIRGVGCGEVLRQLLETELLRIVGRSEELGRPLRYGTTGRFLELYGLGSLNDLPVRDEGAGSVEPTKDNAAADNAA